MQGKMNYPPPPMHSLQLSWHPRNTRDLIKHGGEEPRESEEVGKTADL